MSLSYSRLSSLSMSIYLCISLSVHLSIFLCRLWLSLYLLVCMSLYICLSLASIILFPSIFLSFSFAYCHMLICMSRTFPISVSKSLACIIPSPFPWVTAMKTSQHKDIASQSSATMHLVFSVVWRIMQQ